MDRVSLDLRKIGRLPEALWRVPAARLRSLWLSAVRLLAMFFLTPLILASLAALPEEALALRRFLSSSLSFSMLARMV
ncbi:unnamed protein product, partial [Sphagnum balticum]